jgi:hypothetical protein
MTDLQHALEILSIAGALLSRHRRRLVRPQPQHGRRHVRGLGTGARRGDHSQRGPHRAARAGSVSWILRQTQHPPAAVTIARRMGRAADAAARHALSVQVAGGTAY